MLTYGLAFAAFFVFLSFVYGDVLHRTEQESYISTSPDTLYYLLSQPFGRLYWLGRWGLLIFKWPLLGGAVLALVYTLTARLIDYALCLPRRLEGLGVVAGLGQIGWMLWMGTGLYFKNEPSRFILLAALMLLVSALMAAVVWIFRRRHPATLPDRVRPYGLIAVLLLSGGVSWAALRFNDNEILTARMQNLVWEQRWEDMVSAARSAVRPTRTIAVYHAIALLQQGQLLEGMYDIPYDFYRPRLNNPESHNEYNLFLADANFYSGLLNASYRNAMDNTVMNGPRLVNFKRMALCAMLNGEKELCRKYLALVGRSPGEQAFVEKYGAMADDPKLAEKDEELKKVLELYPLEDHFEQNYREPAFLGYNVGLSTGSDATLVTSAAACLYSKDLQSFLPRAQVMAQKGMAFPPCMQEAIAIMALKQPELLKAFPQVGRFVPDQINSFLLDAKPYVKDRLALRHELRDRWLGTYTYYYYTENNDPDQVVKSYKKTESAGVN